MPVSPATVTRSPELQTELQLGDGVLPPPDCDLIAVAGHAFAMALSRGWAAHLLARLFGVGNGNEVGDCELCIRLVDLSEGAQLNDTWRSQPTATNVLSFGADILAGIGGVAEVATPLGDLVLCVEVVEREAREQNKTLADHYTHLTVHGMLHLLGYDHVDETEAQDMEAMEVAMLRSLGLPNPYEAKPYE